MTNDEGGGESVNAQGKSVPVPGLMQVASLGNSISGPASLCIQVASTLLLALAFLLSVYWSLSTNENI